jgi:hypothetical protein
VVKLKSGCIKNWVHRSSKQDFGGCLVKILEAVFYQGFESKTGLPNRSLLIQQ